MGVGESGNLLKCRFLGSTIDLLNHNLDLGCGGESKNMYFKEVFM